MAKCEACGTTKNINGALGGTVLCKAHYQDIVATAEQLRADGKPVNVPALARKIFKEQFASDYLLRDVPTELWDRAKHRAIDDGVSLRELLIAALEAYLK